ncbi:YXWGXW repeat-containing protein [Spirosoma panaciterrae]|uniref:YXWGXW repeat-containing protein n=1 Tax=Spirosoma panaciterrae TaxID=496058 RepID=UPI000362420A|nr:YXWGXW repeat-containing protein [Spirosoma panaciterrae]
MKTKKNVLAVVSFVCLALVSACTATTTVQGPPAARVERIPPPPSVRHVWVPGHYVRRGRDYRWVGGSYRLAPGRYTAWSPGHWQQTRRGPVWVEGHWQ